MNESTTKTTPQERAQALARTFHSLRDMDTVERWDPDALDHWATHGASHGEKLAVCFVLNVYNQYHKWGCGRFDLIEAYGVWDSDHWDAFRAWVDHPYML